MTKSIQTEQLRPDAKGITRAVDILRDGGRVAFPTETVFGLGADASNGDAVAGIYEAKGRPSFNPLIVHVADLETAKSLAEFNETALQLADAFWPGPMSLVLPLKAGNSLSSLVTAGLDTVAIRIPAHPLAKTLLAEFGGAIAAPSANPSGRISATNVVHVLSGLDTKIEAVLMGNGVTVGLESTILMPLPDRLIVLRQGGVPIEQIARTTPLPISLNTQDDTAPKSPGQLMAHYAPTRPLRINATKAKETEIFIGFGDLSGDFNLSPRGDLRETAANLFDMLHRSDALAQAAGKTIAVALIPSDGLGAAINDRLNRAASG